MQRLLAGYSRFRTNVFPIHAGLFQELALGQKPEALFITCSDSRVMPEMILQCEPGQIFPIRNAGNLVPAAGESHSGVAATIEYAVRALKVADIILCGHTGCGAMREVLEQKHTDALPDVTSWLRHTGPSAKWLRGILEDSSAHSHEERLRLITEANVLIQLEHLRQHAAIAEGLKSQTLRIHGWMYDIATGEIGAFHPEEGIFKPLETPTIRPEQKIA